MQIDKSKPVLVTGATGYIAGWLIKRLLEDGVTVHGTVRNPDKKEKVAHLDKIAAESPGSIKYFKADLLDENGFAEAMEGCGVVFHTASPFVINVKDPQKELIDPAVQGTSNVLEQANKTESVKRVVLTSSCAAIYTDASDVANAPGGVLTEEVWNTTASLDYQPYSLSKTLAEKKGWEIAEKQDRWDLVVINPSAVFGPALNTNANISESVGLLKQLGDGTMKSGVPNLGMGFVDVRDVAEAHYQAGFKPEAKGRHITSAHNSTFLEVAQILNKKYGEKYPIPKKAVPKWLLSFIGPMINKAITRRFVRNNINIPWKADNSKIQKELGIKFRPLETTLYETFEDLIDHNLVKAKK